MNTLIWTNVIYNFPVLNEYNKENSWKLFKMTYRNAVEMENV